MSAKLSMKLLGRT